MKPCYYLSDGTCLKGRALAEANTLEGRKKGDIYTKVPNPTNGKGYSWLASTIESHYTYRHTSEHKVPKAVLLADLLQG